jgi:hypothetical protein
MEPLELSAETTSAMQVEVLDLCLSKPVTVGAMANALTGSRRVIDRHGNLGNQSTLARVTRKLQNLAFRRTKPEEDSLKRRYELLNALNRLEKLSDSTTKKVSSWEEAKEVLSSVFKFPDEEEGAVAKAADESVEDDTTDKYVKRLDDCFRKEERENLVPLTDKWKQVAAVPRPGKLGEGRENDSGAHRTALDKADNMFTLSLASALDELETIAQNKAVKEVEERMLEQERAEEARQRASALMRPLTYEEQATVRDAMYGIGPGDDVLAQEGPDYVQRSSMQTLQPGQWLNDEVIHHFLLMLSKRDEERCQKDPSKKRCHFFKSFFITKLLNEGHSNPNIEGTYEYRNVKRWSKKVPGKDLSKLDKIVFPINEGRMHWLCAVAFIPQKRIEMYDSMGTSGLLYLESIFRYLQDDYMDKKGSPMPDVDEWKIVTCQRSTPRQRNGKF